MTLAELERDVQAHVLRGGPLPGRLADAVAAPAVERWDIYVEAYRLRLVEALATAYPALATRLGRPAFDDRMRAFVAATPSVHRSVRDYGEELAAFLAGDDAESATLSELAAFEWRLAFAFDAPAGTPAAIADLATVAPAAWPELSFRGVPSLSRFTTRTNAVAVWRAAKAVATEGAAPADPPRAERIEPVEWLVHRRGLDTEFRSVPRDEADALDALLGGTPFGELCEALVPAEGDAAALRAATWLKGWLQEELLERA